MECRLIALYVTVEQELAISDLFYAKGWPYHPEGIDIRRLELFTTIQSYKMKCHNHYAPNFEEVEGAYWFGSVRAVSLSVCL